MFIKVLAPSLTRLIYNSHYKYGTYIIFTQSQIIKITLYICI